MKLIFKERKRSKNRSRLQIIADILKNAKSGLPKTRLIRDSNLSYSLFQRYLDFLLRKELIEEIETEEGILLQPTDKGKKFLFAFKRIQEII